MHSPAQAGRSDSFPSIMKGNSVGLGGSAGSRNSAHQAAIGRKAAATVTSKTREQQWGAVVQHHARDGWSCTDEAEAQLHCWAAIHPCQQKDD